MGVGAAVVSVCFSVGGSHTFIYKKKILLLDDSTNTRIIPVMSLFLVRDIAT
jgi:hypothetical protein